MHDHPMPPQLPEEFVLRAMGAFGPAILVAAPAMLVAMPVLWMMVPGAMGLAKMLQAIAVRQWDTAHEKREHDDPSQYNVPGLSHVIFLDAWLSQRALAENAMT